MLLCPAPGVYHGTLNFDPNSDGHIDSTQLLPYPPLSSPGSSSPQSHPEVPTSILITEFHFILLYRDRTVGICTLNGKQTYEDVIPLVRKTILAEVYISRCCRDHMRQSRGSQRILFVRHIGFIRTSRYLSWWSATRAVTCGKYILHSKTLIPRCDMPRSVVLSNM